MSGTAITNAVDDVRARFEALVARTGDDGGLRRQALGLFEKVGFPTRKDEDWRATSLRRVTEGRFGLPPVEEPDEEVRSLAGRHLLESSSVLNLLVWNGRLLPGHETLPEGVSLRRVEEGSTAAADSTAFAILNRAFHPEELGIEVAEGVVLERPIHFLFVSTEGVHSSPRMTVSLGRGSELKLVETHAGVGGTGYLATPLTELELGPGSQLDYTRLDRENQEACQVGTVRARVDRDATLSSHVVTLSGGLVRNDLLVRLDGEGASAWLDGLYLLSGDQHADHHTTVDHVRPHASSSQLYKGILGDAATGVFNGRVVVRPHAQKSQADQANRNLLLSDTATVDTRPQLEIYADDVRCTHGATIGQLEEISLFYLRSRGLDLATSRELLIYAFASEIVRGLSVGAVRRQLDRLLLERVPIDLRLEEEQG